MSHIDLGMAVSLCNVTNPHGAKKVRPNLHRGSRQGGFSSSMSVFESAIKNPMFGEICEYISPNMGFLLIFATLSRNAKVFCIF